MGRAVDDPWPRGLANDLAAMLLKLRDPRGYQHAPDHGALPGSAADGLGASLVPIHRDAAQGTKCPANDDLLHSFFHAAWNRASGGIRSVQRIRLTAWIS